MLVTTAMVGDKRQKGAVAFIRFSHQDIPLTQFGIGTSPDIKAPADDHGGIQLPLVRMEATMDVVVVLPWAPAMATPYLRRMSSDSISALGMTGIYRSFASRSSGFF
jgi:hypothetical protein